MNTSVFPGNLKLPQLLICLLLSLQLISKAQTNEFTESNLPVIIIDTYGSTIPDDPKIEAHLGIIDNGHGAINIITDPFNGYDGKIGIETRGHSTQLYPKKSYGIELRDENGNDISKSILGMPEESDWILYAPYADKSLLRNAITFNLGQMMGRSYSSRTRFCEVILNGEYQGIYVMMEKIKRDKARVDISKLNQNEVFGDEVTGGYILSVDWRDDDFQFHRDGFKTTPEPSYPNAMDITFQYVYPKAEDIVDAQRNYIKSYVTNAELALVKSSFKDPETGYQKYFDIPSFVDFMILSEITKDVDNYKFSQYFYKKRDSDGGKIFAGPAWDYNFGYGNVDYWNLGLGSAGWIYEELYPYDYSRVYWWKRMMDDSYFRNMVKTRWQSLRQNELSNQAILSMIDSLLAVTAQAQERNFVRWPILGTYIWPNYDWQDNTYQDEVTYVRSFLFSRLYWMDYAITGKVITPRADIFAEKEKIFLKIHEDYFTTKVLKPEYFQLNNAPATANIVAVEATGASDCILTLSTDISGLSDVSVTVKDQAINTWSDVTSNKLETASISESIYGNLQVYADREYIHIKCSNPAVLPSEAKVCDMHGRIIKILPINKVSTSSIKHNLKAGFYIFVIDAAARKFVIAG